MNTLLAQHTEKLYYFFEIANAGSMQACSRKIGITTPTLSYNISSLEKILKIKLFDRNKTGVTLTESGNKLWAFCNHYYKELEKVESDIINPKLKKQLRIRVGTFQSIALYFIPRLLQSLKKDPNVSVSMMTERSAGVLEALVKRDIDIALTVETFKQTDLIRHEIYRDEYAFYISNDYPKKTLSLDDIKELTLIYIPDAIDMNKISLREYIRRRDLQFKEEFELDSFEVCAEFIIKKLGIGILPKKVAARLENHIKPVRIQSKTKMYFGTHRFFLSYREDLDLPQRIITTVIDLAYESANIIS